MLKRMDQITSIEVLNILPYNDLFIKWNDGMSIIDLANYVGIGKVKMRTFINNIHIILNNEKLKEQILTNQIARDCLDCFFKGVSKNTFLENCGKLNEKEGLEIYNLFNVLLTKNTIIDYSIIDKD